MRRRRFAGALRVRAGFTLLEMILALALGFALIVSIYVAASLHLRMADRGPATAEYAHRIYQALNRIGDDLRHTLSLPPGAKPSSGSSSVQGDQVGNTGTTLGTDSEAGEAASVSIAGKPYGIWGDVDVLVLYRIVRPTDIDLADALAAQGISASRPAVHRITYSLLEEVNEQGEIQYALYRSQVPAGLETLADELPIDPSAYPHYEKLLDGVVFLQFSYFDGASWLETWGDLEPTDPPVAVEVVLAVQPPERLGRLAQRVSPLAQLYGLPAGVDVFRKVVVIRTADASQAAEVSSELASF